jgi:hypothetical protein
MAAGGKSAAVVEAADHRILGFNNVFALGQWLAPFVRRLQELGRIEGRTVAIEYRWADGRSERFAEIAAEFVRLKVYDRSGNLLNSGVSYGNGTGMTASGNRIIRTGNTVRTYDSSGRVMFTGHWRGNVFKFYNGNGRLIGTGHHNSERMYDTRGRYIGTATHSAGPVR